MAGLRRDKQLQLNSLISTFFHRMNPKLGCASRIEHVIDLQKVIDSEIDHLFE